jgi:hypothetical protein
LSPRLARKILDTLTGRGLWLILCEEISRLQVRLETVWMEELTVPQSYGYSQTIEWFGKLESDKRSSLFCSNINDEIKEVYNTGL